MTLLLALALALQTPVSGAPPAGATISTASGLRFETLKPGTGPRPRIEDAVRVTYVGRLADGRVFDRADQPVGLAVGNLVPGFTEALLLMNKGGTYRIWIPPELAYGTDGAGGVIPPNATLDFTVTLVDIGPPAAPRP